MNLTKIAPKDFEYFCFSMRRSGHHAVINWILLNFQSYVHYNNCFSKENELYTESERNIVKLGSFPYEIKILSFEDRPVFAHESHFWGSFESILAAGSVGRLYRKKNILVLRDAYNTFASRLKKGIKIKKYDLDLWKIYAKEFLGETNFLGSDCIKISFNNWFSKKQYREDLALKFNRPNADKGLLDVPSFGDGSSFDGLDYNKNGQKMNVLKRWKSFYKNKDYENVITDKEIKELNKKIFNFSIQKIH